MQHFKSRLDEEKGKDVCAAGWEAGRQRETVSPPLLKQGEETLTSSRTSLEMHLQRAGGLMGWKRLAHQVFIEKNERIN